MKNNLPFFKYHPNPLATGNAVEKVFVCLCCNQQKKVAYVGGIYSVHDVDREMLCLECIADGSAAKKWDASFGGELQDGERFTSEIIDEFENKTPSYISWQGAVWLTHCDDICEFHGDFTKKELIDHFEDIKDYAKEHLGCRGGDEELKEIIQHYEPIGNPAFYKFICIQCKKVLVHVDFT